MVGVVAFPVVLLQLRLLSFTLIAIGVLLVAGFEFDLSPR